MSRRIKTLSRALRRIEASRAGEARRGWRPVGEMPGAGHAVHAALRTYGAIPIEWLLCAAIYSGWKQPTSDEWIQRANNARLLRDPWTTVRRS